MGRPTGPTKAVVALVWERDQGSCARCGTGLLFEDRGFGWSVHHRSPRGMGGSKAPHVNRPANLVTLCGSGVTGCHGWVESHREQATTDGWLVSRHGRVLPMYVALFDAVGNRFWLDDYGGRDEQPEQPF